MKGRDFDIIRERLQYDPETGSIIWLIATNNSTKVGSEAGWKTIQGYRRLRINTVLYQAHRIAWFLYYGSMPSDQIDHINGVRGDNRITNLRVVTNRENGQNMSIHREGRLPGTYKIKKCRTKPWVARAKINGKNIHIGCYPTEIEAYNAYMAKVRMN